MQLDILNSVFTSAFLGLIWALIKVVEYFINKNKKEEKPEYLDLLNKNAELLISMNRQLETIIKMGTLTEQQEKAIEEAAEDINKLLEMHQVYNENRVPIWYFPTETSKIIKDLPLHLNNLEMFMSDLKTDQSEMFSRLSDLISSQKVVTERLSDLISALTKVTR